MHVLTCLRGGGTTEWSRHQRAFLLFACFYALGILLSLLPKATYNRSSTHSHAEGGVNHAGRQLARQEQSGRSVSLRDYSPLGAGDRARNHPVTSCKAFIVSTLALNIYSFLLSQTHILVVISFTLTSFDGYTSVFRVPVNLLYLLSYCRP